MSVAAITARMQAIELRMEQLAPSVWRQAAGLGQAGAGDGTTDFSGVLHAALATDAQDAAGGPGGASPLDAVWAPSRPGASGATTTAARGTLVDNGATGADVVADARRYLGVPYVFGGTTTSGLDCSGLVQKVFGDLGVTVPRLVTGQMTMGVAVSSLAQAKPGDLIVADGGNHIAIYAGDGEIIEAPRPGLTVRERGNWITAANTVTIRRIVPGQSQAVAR